METVPKLRDFNFLRGEKFQNENISTLTSIEQIKTENLVEKCYNRFLQLQCLDNSIPQIHREQHIQYLENSLRSLSSAYECLDSSRPWLVYWILNSANLLNYKFNEDILNNTVEFLAKCRDANGGFGGGPGQKPHLATTYAAVNSCCIIGTEKAYNAIHKVSLEKFLLSLREENGAFRLHVDGEIDVRGVYCALSCARLANFTTEEEEKLFANTANWISECQTYEGGFGGAPYLEAHGGYTFCGIASLVMLGKADFCNLKQLLKWVVGRQMRYEGGFQGRTNKLVDGCYSFWVGSTLAIIQAVLSKNDPFFADILRTPLFNRHALQEYVLICCQKPSGGLIDKPGKGQDLYHTCYTLSGISVAQHCEFSAPAYILGNPDNELLPIHPLHNINPSAAIKSYNFFKNYELRNFLYDTSQNSIKKEEN